MTSIATELRQIAAAAPKADILKAAAAFFLGLRTDLNRYLDAAHRVHGARHHSMQAVLPADKIF